MTVAVRADAKVYSFVFPQPTPVVKGVAPKPVSTSKLIDFKEIKTGDNVSITLNILPTGQIEGTTVIVLPPPPTTAPTVTPKAK